MCIIECLAEDITDVHLLPEPQMRLVVMVCNARLVLNTCTCKRVCVPVMGSHGTLFVSFSTSVLLTLL